MSPSKQSKKHLARLEVERRQDTAIRIGVISIVVIVAVLMLYAYFTSPAGLAFIGRTFRQNEAVAVVGEKEITLREFQNRVRFERQQMIRQYQQTVTFAQMYNIDINSNQYILSQLSQLKMTLDSTDPNTLGQQVLTGLIKEELVRQEAQKRGITVSKEEVLAKMQESQGYFKDGTPTPTATPTVLPTMTLSAQQLQLVTITPTPTLVLTETPTLTPTLDPAITPTLTATPLATATALPTQAPQPTPTQYTLDGYEKRYKDILDQLAPLNWTEDDLYHYIENGIYRDRLFEVITSEIPNKQEQVWARHILVKDESTAKEIYEKLKAGGDFALLAKIYSQDTGSKDNGGDLGWFSKGAMIPEFESLAFSAQVGVINEPVYSAQTGWHIIQVLGHAENPVDDAAFQKIKEQAFTDFVDGLLKTGQDAGTIKEFPDFWKSFVPMEPDLTKEMEKLNSPNQ